MTLLARVLAGLLLPALASASTSPYAEARVKGFDLGTPASISAERAVTPDTHRGYTLGYDDLASGSLLAARGPMHHVMTNKNWVSALRGGPWSPRFSDMARKAGMTLDDVANKVAVPGHLGPHPEAYHQAVFDRLTAATNGLSGDAYSAAFRAELGAISTEAATAGSYLSRLLTGF